ncbi:MAG TPA: PASTA domain-containing protein [Gaiellaceae bacterium]|nr:PASTA domain-containing protein [Gaiellaceae bacterium]
MHLDFGHARVIDDGNEITQPHAPLPEDTEAHEPVVPPPATGGPPQPPPGPPPPAPPAGGPPAVPPRLYQDAWPWLAALGILAVVGLLLWLFVFRDTSSSKLVPAVVGLQQQQAIERLTGDGFGVRAVIAPSKKPKGIVFAQVPGGGSRLDKGQNVEIRVSNGLAPTTSTAATTTRQTTTQQQTTQQQTTAAAQQASVPDVGGQAAADAAGQIEAAGFVAETEPVAESGTAGSVVTQSPPAGSSADVGSVVVLSVATGSNRPASTVPDVVGQKAAAARAALLDAKLTVKTAYKKGKRGVVLAQSVAGGQSQPAWTQVTITVGS